MVFTLCDPGTAICCLTTFFLVYFGVQFCVLWLLSQLSIHSLLLQSVWAELDGAAFAFLVAIFLGWTMLGQSGTAPGSRWAALRMAFVYLFLLYSLYSSRSKTGIREGGVGYFRCCWSQASDLGRQGMWGVCVGKWGFTKSEILSCFCRHECKTQTRGGFGFDLVK